MLGGYRARIPAISLGFIDVHIGTLPVTNIALKIGSTKGSSYSNHGFSGVMLVSESVILLF